MFSHIFTSVSNFERAFTFYSGVLDTLHLELRFHEPQKPWAGWHGPGGDRPLFVICKPFDGLPHQPGNGQMVAFAARNRFIVRAPMKRPCALAARAKARRACGRSTTLTTTARTSGTPRATRSAWLPTAARIDAERPPMNDANKSWDIRLAALWNSLPHEEPERFLENMEALAAELPSGDAIALFELASAQDSTGHSDLAVPLYRSALAAGLSGIRRRRATIQLASSLRNVGKADEAHALLEAELREPADELSSAVSGFMALVLNDLHRAPEALGHALSALSTHLPRYNASLRRYAEALMTSPPDGPVPKA